MLDWLNSAIGTIGVLGVLVTVLSSLNGRQSNRLLGQQAQILEGQQQLLAQMEANAEGRHGAVMETREGRPPGGGRG